MKRIIITLIFSLNLFQAYSQAGNIDSTFSNDGITTTFNGGYGCWEDIQSDGKIIVGGTNSNNFFALARFNSNGIPDSTFSGDGKVTFTTGIWGNSGGIVKLQPDGKILISGDCVTNIGGNDFSLARLNIDGTLDNTFSNDGKVTNSVSPSGHDDSPHAIAIQPDGKIVQVGLAWDNSSARCFAAIRYNANGTLDNSFGTGGKTLFTIGNEYPSANSVIVLSNQKILISGTSSSVGGGPICFALACLNSNGTLDNTFGIGGKVITYFGPGDANDFSNSRAMTIQPDGKIILAGNSGIIPNTYGTIAIARYKINGSLDKSFGTFGKMTCQVPNYPVVSIFDCDLQQDGKIIVVGQVDPSDTSSYNLVARINTNGVLDTTFGNSGFVFTKIDSEDNGHADVAIQTDGKIVASGWSNSGFTVMRYLSGLNVGILDLSVSENPILIYPNPVHSQATLQYTLNGDEHISIELFDIQGKMVQQFFINENRHAGKHEEVLQFNELLTSGNYILSIGNGKNSQGVKLMKE